MSPSLSDVAVLRPCFQTRFGEFEAGKAFALGLEGEELLVTCLHLFGPAGGFMSRAPRGGALASLVTGVKVQELGDQRLVGTTVGCRTPAGADAEVPEEDLCAFVLAGGHGCAPLSLAQGSPEPGAPVWLASPLRGSSPADPVLHPARCFRRDGELLVVDFDDPELKLQGTSGAPLLDASGEVVGMLVRFRQSPQELYGIALGAEGLRARLGEAPAEPHAQDAGPGYPVSILSGLPWSMGTTRYKSPEEVDAEVRDFYAPEPPPNWRPDEVVLESPGFELLFSCYDAGPPNDEHDVRLSIKAPDGVERFRAVELIFQLHNAVATHLQEHQRDLFDHHFFEGLRLVRRWEGPSALPWYAMWLGS